MNIDGNLNSRHFFCNGIPDTLTEIYQHLETADLIMLSSACKILRTKGNVWETLAKRYDQPLESNSSQLIEYLKTPKEISVYHLLDGLQRRSLSKNRYQVYPATKLADLQKIVSQISKKIDLNEVYQDEDHCEFILAEEYPYYYVNNNDATSVLKLDRQKTHPSQPNQDKFYQIAKLNPPSNFREYLLPIYEEITHEHPNQPARPKSCGPFGLFSLERDKWKPLNSMSFFQQNRPLDQQTECHSLRDKSILVITDISATKDDAAPQKLLKDYNNDQSIDRDTPYF